MSRHASPVALGVVFGSLLAVSIIGCLAWLKDGNRKDREAWAAIDVVCASFSSQMFLVF